MLLPFFQTSWGVGVLNSVIFNSFHNRVDFGTILEGHWYRLCLKCLPGFLRAIVGLLLYNTRMCKGKHNEKSNVRWGAFFATIVAVENKKYCIFWLCVGSLMYPACNAHAPFCNLLPVQLYNIFPHYLINGTIFEKQNVIEHKKCVLIFPTTPKHCWCKTNWARSSYDKKCISVLT